MSDTRPLLDAKLKDEVYGRHIDAPVVNTEKCIGCGECVRCCPTRVFELKVEKAMVAWGDACIACGHCWAVCPTGAVTQSEVTTATEIVPGKEPAVSPEALQLLLRERRSVRLFDDRPVSREDLEKIINAGRYAPTGSNLQDVNYSVVPNVHKVDRLRLLVDGFLTKLFEKVDSRLIGFLYSLRRGRKSLEALRAYSKHFHYIRQRNDDCYIFLPRGAAVVLVHSPSLDDLGSFNCALAIYNGALMAHGLGLGTCFVGFLQVGVNMSKPIKRFLNIPSDHTCHGAMVLGYPDLQYRRLIERTKPKVEWVE